MAHDRQRHAEAGHGNFITTLLLPGIPLLEWGEEQAYYVLDNTASNYVFGRQPMSSATAWQDHGCYTVGNAKFATWLTAPTRMGATTTGIVSIIAIHHTQYETFSLSCSRCGNDTQSSMTVSIFNP